MDVGWCGPWYVLVNSVASLDNFAFDPPICLITSLTHYDAVDFECTSVVWCSPLRDHTRSARVEGRRSMPGSCRSSLAMRHPKMKDYDEDACDWRYRWLLGVWSFVLRHVDDDDDDDDPLKVKGKALFGRVAIPWGCPVSKMTVSIGGWWRTFQPRCLGYDQGLCFGVG